MNYGFISERSPLMALRDWLHLFRLDLHLFSATACGLIKTASVLSQLFGVFRNSLFREALSENDAVIVPPLCLT